MSNKKGLSPLIATMLLVVFALIVGTATMSWGQTYVNEVESKEEVSSYVISIAQIKDDELKKLQIDYILDVIDREEYLRIEKELLKS